MLCPDVAIRQTAMRTIRRRTDDLLEKRAFYRNVMSRRECGPSRSTRSRARRYSCTSSNTLLQACSVRHGVDDIIDADADSQLGELFRIARVIGVLPGVAQVHVVADGHHEASLVVVDAAPNRNPTVMLVGYARFEELRARYLIAIIKIVD